MSEELLPEFEPHSVERIPVALDAGARSDIRLAGVTWANGPVMTS